MRKTTIFRSSARVVGAVGAIAVATAPAFGQDDTTAVRQAAQPQEPDIHVVQEGETLWTIAEFYLGDPLLWPEIYRINTVVVEDPHWIFPGEELLLAPREMLAVEPEPEVVDDPAVVPVEPERAARDLDPTAAPPPPPPPPAEQVPTVFASNRPPMAVPQSAARRPGGDRPISRSQHYSAGFLTEWDPIPWATVIGAADQSVLSGLTATSAVVMYEQLGLLAPEGTAYQVGDTLLVAEIDRELVDWGGVVVPTGIVKVVAVSGRDIQAEVTSQFGRIADGQVALPIEAAANLGGRTQEIANGMMGNIIQVRDLHPVPNITDVVFLNLGRSSRIAVGDVFEVLVPRQDFPDRAGRRVGQLRVVHVRERSSSAVITNISDLGIAAGAPVRLIRKSTS